MKVKGEKGFTLVELAIVLVIIGIIMGIVLKGQDLIQNARMKKLANTVRKWEVGLWTCYDRTGHFPGDTDKDGIINEDPLNCTDDASCICFQHLAQGVSDNKVQLGSYTFYIYPGSDNHTTPARNVLVVCGKKECNGAVAGDQLDFLRSFDTSIDGEANGTVGVVRGSDGVSATNDVATLSGEAKDEWSNSTKGAIYYFDRRP